MVLERVEDRIFQQGQGQPNYNLKPETALDYNLMIVQSVWGKEVINADLQEKLKQTRAVYQKKNEAGEVIETFVDKESLWGTLSFYTQDLRLANLSPSQFKYCAYYLDLAGDCLRLDMVEPFLMSLSRVATILELSQSQGGFLRNRLNTLTTENVQRIFEPPKRSLMTGKEKQ